MRDLTSIVPSFDFNLNCLTVSNPHRIRCILTNSDHFKIDVESYRY